MRRRGVSWHARKVRLAIGAVGFTGRLEALAAPKSVAWLAERLPLKGTVMHARWSGEAAWMSLEYRGSLEPENATAYPHPGQLLVYAGDKSEPELLVPYGACAFASRAGALAGNHVVTLEGDLEGLRARAENLLREGAEPLQLTWA
jgi:Protein of unknown function (DUF3830)